MTVLNPYMVSARLRSRLAWIPVRMAARREAKRVQRSFKYHLVEALKRWLMFSLGTITVILIGTVTSPQVMSWW